MATTTKPTPFWRDVLAIHPAAELFPLMSPDDLKALGEDIKKNGLTTPIAIVSTKDTKGWHYKLVDGRNRLDAMELVGVPFNLMFSPGGCRIDWNEKFFQSRVINSDPYAYVISANIHRRHLTAEQRRELITKLIKATPEKSDRQIAETVKASPTTVGAVRAKANGEVSKLDTRTDAKGVKQPATKKTAAAVVEQRHQARVLKQERERARARARKEREEWQADISRFAHKLIQLDIETARELYRVLVECGGDAMQLMDDLAAGIEIEDAGKFNKGEPEGNEADPDASAEAMKAKFAEMDDGLDIPASLRRAAP
jgi:ParB-like nuclease family protein